MREREREIIKKKGTKNPSFFFPRGKMMAEAIKKVLKFSSLAPEFFF